MRHFLPTLLLLLSGCSEQNLTKGTFNDTGDAADTGGGDGSNDSAEDTGPDTLPASYTVEASLVIQEGVAVTEGAAVSALVIGDDGATVLCTVPLEAAGVVVDEAPDPDIGAWWAVEVEPVDSSCAPLPRTLHLGIGVMAPDVLAQLGAVGMDAYAASLFGAYIAGEDGTVYVYGWAGTEADASGDDPAALPLPDGVYGLHPLYLLPLP